MPSLIMKRVALLGVALFLLSASTAQAEDVVLRPALPTNRLVVIIHGSGGHAAQIKDRSIFPEVQTYLRRGFAVAASDADGPQNWGNPASVADIEHMIDRLSYERVFLEGGSMGGLDTMQLIGRVHPEAVGLISPVCNLSRLGAIPPVAVEEAWGKRRPAYLSPVAPHPERGLPVKIWASPEDTWVPKRFNANACARQLRHRGADVDEIPITGEHTSPHPGLSRALPKFFSAVASR